MFVLILIAGLLIFLRQSSLRWQRQNTSQRNLADLRIRQHQQVIVKTYKGRQAQAARRFEDNSMRWRPMAFFQHRIVGLRASGSQ